jgi:hypothetical protein
MKRRKHDRSLNRHGIRNAGNPQPAWPPESLSPIADDAFHHLLPLRAA